MGPKRNDLDRPATQIEPNRESGKQLSHSNISLQTEESKTDRKPTLSQTENEKNATESDTEEEES